MPIVKFKCIREVTSEDANFPAENLLKEPAKKWKTKSVGEKSAYVIFELEKAVQITGIDIGNEHSAFVEVLVSNGCRPEDFTEILITCSFMTPIESKNSSNPNRVRCFGKDALVASVATEKWNLIKVFCTQPFNKHVQYGLSFIKIHTAEVNVSKNNIITKAHLPENVLLQKEKNKTNDAASAEKGSSEKTKILANFTLREESPDSDSESSGALFSRWKKSRQNEIFSRNTETIRQATTIPSRKKSTENLGNPVSVVQADVTSNSQLSKIRDRNRTDLAFSIEDEPLKEDKKLQRLSKHIEEDRKRLSEKMVKPEKKSENKVTKPENVLKNIEKTNVESKHKEKELSSNEKSSLSSNRKRASSPIGVSTKKLKSQTPIVYRPFHQLLRGVVLVISGIQNPDRANLRGKALAMGAKYKADWEPDCTHLICAFKNTPKYNQVKGKGKIVKREWIEKCFELKKYLPWRRFALDDEEKTKPESDTEILDEELKQVTEREEVVDVKRPVLQPANCRSLESISDKRVSVDSGSDTDDDIQRITKKNKESEFSSKEKDIYEVTTEEEEYFPQQFIKPKNSLSFFENIKIFLDNDLTPGKKTQLERCIEHYSGSITQNINEADILIAENKPEISRPENFTGEMVRPQWIFECNDMEQKLKFSPYIIARK